MKFSSLALSSAATLVLSGSLFAQSGPAIGTLKPCDNAIFDCENGVALPGGAQEVLYRTTSTPMVTTRTIYRVGERPKPVAPIPPLTSIFVVKENAPVSVQRPTEFVVVPQSIGPGWAYVPK